MKCRGPDRNARHFPAYVQGFLAHPRGFSRALLGPRWQHIASKDVHWGLLIVHILAVVKHLVINKYRTLMRMVRRPRA